MSGGRGKGASISKLLPGSGNRRSPPPPWWSPVAAGGRLVALVTGGGGGAQLGTRAQGRRSVLRSLNFPRRNLSVGQALLAISAVGFGLHLLLDLLSPTRPRYDLSPDALRIGSVDGLPPWPRPPGNTGIHAAPGLGIPAVEFPTDHAPANPSIDPFCDPPLADLDPASAEMASWLDEVAGVCTGGMTALDIRERVLRILELRSALPMPELRLLSPDRLREVVVYASPLFPNNLGQLGNGNQGGLDEVGINRSAVDVPYTGWFPMLFRIKFERTLPGMNVDLFSRGWVADERLHGVMGMAAVNSLTAFEFKLLLSLEYVKHDYRHYAAAPPLARPALILAGLATPAASFKFYNTAWIDALRRLDAQLNRGFEMAGGVSEERSHAVAYVESLRDEASPMLVVEAVRLLGGHLAAGRSFTDANVRAHKAALPRGPWQSGSIAMLPRWDGAAPPAASQLSAKIAIVIPFHDAELHKIDHFLKFWPMTAAPDGISVVMALNTDFGTPSGRVIRGSLLKIWRRHKLEGVMPLYLLSLRQPNTNHYDGAALSFYQLLGFLGGFFPAMQLMETDVRPIGSAWVSKLAAAAVGACSQWWIKGSAQLCSPLLNHRFDKRGDFHINGNGMYALGCPAFAHLVRRAQAFYPPSGVMGGQCDTMGGCETTIEFGGGYDHVLYNYRMDPAHFHYIRRVLPMFQYTLAVANYCEERANVTEIAARSDQTALVHSKFHLYSPEEQILIEVFNKVLLRLPEAYELQRFWPKLRYGTMTADDVLADLCQLIHDKAKSLWEETIDTSIMGFRWSKAKPDEARYHRAIDACPPTGSAPPAAAAPKGRSSAHWGIRSKRRGADDRGWVGGGDGLRKVPIQAHMSSLSTLGCAMPVLAELGVVLKHSSDPEACANYGYCLDNSVVDPLAAGVHFNLCGGSIASCQQFKTFVKTPLVVLLTGDGIQQDCAGGDAAIFQWTKAVRHLGAAPNVLVVAADDYAAHRIAKVFKLAPKVARGWCGDLHNDAAVKSGGRTSAITLGYMPARHEVLVWSQEADGTAGVTQLRKELQAVTSRHHDGGAVEKGGIAGSGADLVFENTGSDLSAGKAIRHPAIVVLPTGPLLATPETVALYRLNIPLFVPSGSLMDGWFASRLGAAEGDAPESVASWPGTVPYDSAQDLIDRLRAANLTELSAIMVEHNRAERLELAENWTEVLSGVRLLIPDGTV